MSSHLGFFYLIHIKYTSICQGESKECFLSSGLVDQTRWRKSGKAKGHRDLWMNVMTIAHITFSAGWTYKNPVLEMKLWIYWSESKSWLYICIYMYLYILKNWKNWKINWSKKVWLVFGRRTDAHREDIHFYSIYSCDL